MTTRFETDAAAFAAGYVRPGDISPVQIGNLCVSATGTMTDRSAPYALSTWDGGDDLGLVEWQINAISNHALRWTDVFIADAKNNLGKKGAFASRIRLTDWDTFIKSVSNIVEGDQ